MTPGSRDLSQAEMRMTAKNKAVLLREIVLIFKLLSFTQQLFFSQLEINYEIQEPTELN